jgi:pyrimidine-specific ribonucleoside hydrolase
MNKTGIPIACGPNKPLAGNHHYPANVLQESDTLAGTAKLLPAVKSIPPGNAIDLIINTLQQSRQPMTILALGPLTNIALALQKQPAIKNQIKTLYVMGGAVNVSGNLPEVDKTIKNTVAEWNIYIDPLAADKVFKQNIPIVLVSLDVTNQLPIDMVFYQRLKKKHTTPEANYVFALLNNNMKILETHEWYFWDPLAAVIATDESIANFKTYPLKIELTPEERSGATRIDAQGNNVSVVIKADADKFKDMLLDQLNK